MIPCLLLLPAALLLDILFGDPPNRRHPVCLIGWCARRLEPAARRLWGGSFKAGMLAALGVCAAAECGLFLLFLPFFTLSSLTASPWLPWIPAVLAVYICMAPRGLAEHAARVFSTLFWAAAGCLIGGALGAAAAALVHRVFNILDAMWGKKNEQYRHFGTFAARTDDTLNFIPARLILSCISLAALFLPGASSRHALTVGWTFRRAHASPNSAWSEAAFAGALGLRIGGPVSYKGMPADYPWIGSGRKEATAGDLDRAIRLMWLTTAIGTLLFSLILALPHLQPS